MTALAYCTVVGKFNRLDAGAPPPATPLVGYVTLTPNIENGKVLLATETPPRSIVIDPVVVKLDASGAFSTQVVATDQPGVTNPSGFTYTASFQILGVPAASLDSFAFAAPAGTTVDLTSVAPIPASAGNDSRYGQLAAGNTWTGPQTFRGLIIGRANDAPLGDAQAPAAPIMLKPPSDLTAAAFQFYTSSPVGGIFHLTDDAGVNTTSSSFVFAIGVSGPGTGLVIDNYGAGRGFGATNEAGSTGPLMTFNNFGAGALMEINSGGVGSGHLISYSISSTMPAASRPLTFASSSGANREAWFIDNQMQMHLSAAGVLHQTDFFAGSGLNRKSYVWAAGTTYWAHQEDISTNVWTFSQATNVANKGAETFHVLMQFQNGNAIAWFGATPVVKQGAAGILSGGYVAGTGTALTLDGRFTGLVGGTAYSVNDIVAALKNYGLLVA